MKKQQQADPSDRNRQAAGGDIVESPDVPAPVQHRIPAETKPPSGRRTAGDGPSAAGSRADTQPERLSRKTAPVSRRRFGTQTATAPVVQDFVRPELNKDRERLTSIRPNANDEHPPADNFTMPKRKRKSIVRRLTRHGRAKVYRLVGYTSVAGVRRIRRREERRVRQIKTVLGILAAAAVLAAIIIWNPFPWLREFFRAVGLA